VTTTKRLTGLMAAGLITTATLAIPAVASASTPTVQRSAEMNMADHEFVVTMYQAAQAQIAAGDLAIKQAMMPHVQAHGEHFKMDNEMFAKELKAIAKSEGIPLPASMSASDKAKLDKVAKAKDMDFDKAVFGFEVAVTSRMVKTNAAAAKGETSAAVKKFSADNKKTLNRHYTDLRGMSEMIGVKVPTNVNTGTGAPSGQLPEGMAIVLMLAGAGVAGGSLLTARRASR
jgi:putative membrane protein